MPTFHDLRIRRRELLDELEQMEATVTELTAMLDGIAEPIPEEFVEHREHRAWLQRQQAGVLVTLSETERALLEFGADGWDDE
jgi:alkylhydroperoxidase/carboxymuconolactone decarboxylase family protein YurZ